MSELLNNPIEQFKLWYQEARAAEKDPDAMVLATIASDGSPDARVVLYKGIYSENYNSDGFLFFTNYESEKAKQLFCNAKGALVFYWPMIYRQVRISGNVVQVNEEASHHYFLSRPRGSQISAWASPQSRVIPNREYLIERSEFYKKKFAEKNVTCPEFWGGFYVIPDKIEFWSGCPDRLHDRFRYTRKPLEKDFDLKECKDGVWTVERLAP